MSEPSRPSARPQHNQGAAYKRPVPRRPAALGDQAASRTPAAHDRTHALAHVCTYTCNDLHMCAYMLRSTHTSCTARPTPVTSIRDDVSDDTRAVLCRSSPPRRRWGGALVPGGRAVSPSRWLPVFSPTLCIRLGECALCRQCAAGGPGGCALRDSAQLAAVSGSWHNTEATCLPKSVPTAQGLGPCIQYSPGPLTDTGTQPALSAWLGPPTSKAGGS